MYDVYFGDASSKHSNGSVTQILTKTWHDNENALLKSNLFFSDADPNTTSIHVFDCSGISYIPCAPSHDFVLFTSCGYSGVKEIDMAWVFNIISDIIGLLKYTAQQKFSTDFNVMSHLNEHETFYFNVINMYGDFEINVFSCPPDKM